MKARRNPTCKGCGIGLVSCTKGKKSTRCWMCELGPRPWGVGIQPVIIDGLGYKLKDGRMATWYAGELVASDGEILEDWTPQLERREKENAWYERLGR